MGRDHDNLTSGSLGTKLLYPVDSKPVRKMIIKKNNRRGLFIQNFFGVGKRIYLPASNIFLFENVGQEVTYVFFVVNDECLDRFGAGTDMGSV